MIGRVVGKYRVLERIGRGGMGSVYLAMDDTLQREVAIKVLNSDITDPDALKRFRAEAMTLARLQHPSIGMLFELCEDGGDLLMVMEFVRGETLQKLAERMGRVPPDFAAQLCAQALDGLAYAHRAGIVHRDLKPGNIMVTNDGLVKVMDFGIARVAGTEHLTSDGLSMGTPSYMAPEQVLGREVDGRADLYAIGVVLYRLWTGQLPFLGDTPFAIANKQLNEPPTPLTVSSPDLPPWCSTILARALAKRPEDRFQTAQEFKAALAASARFVTLDDLVTTTMPTPRAVLTSPMPSAGSGGMPFTHGQGTSQAPAAAGHQETGRTLVISARHMFAGVGVIVLVLAVLGLAGIVALRRVPATSGATPMQAAAPVAVPPSAPSSSSSASSGAPNGAVIKPQPAPPSAPPARQDGVPPAATALAAKPAGMRARPDAGAPSAATPPSNGAATPATELAPLAFDKLKVLILDGTKTREEDGALHFSNGRVTIYGEARRVVAAFPYDAVRGVSSARSRQPRWREADGKTVEAKVGGGPLGFLKSDRNWLTLVTPRGPYIVRVDDARLRSLSEAVTSRTGTAVVRLVK